ncbi:GAF and ANTAR domain-containing protein [Nonomuraea sp. NPDC002799]
MPIRIEEFEQALAECVTIAVRAMPDSPMISVCLLAKEGLRTVASSDVRAVLLDELQATAGQGPCIDVLDSGEPVTVTDLAAEPRWRRFSAESGMLSLYSEPLKSDGLLLGVLTLYSGRGGGFSEETQVAARVTAEHISVLFRTALHAARLREVAVQLKEALATRAIIDQALGIVMAQRRCTARQAFEVLRHVSQAKNVKLSQVAATIVETVSGAPPQRSRFEEPPAKVSRKK